MAHSNGSVEGDPRRQLTAVHECKSPDRLIDRGFLLISAVASAFLVAQHGAESAAVSC